MEAQIRAPRLVKQNVIAQVTDAIEHLANVIDRAVVRDGLHDEDAEGPWPAPCVRVLHQRMLLDLAANRFFIPRVIVHGTDEALSVAIRFEIDRDAAGE